MTTKTMIILPRSAANEGLQEARIGSEEKEENLEDLVEWIKE